MKQRDLDNWYERIATKAADRGWDDAEVRADLQALWHAEESFGAYAQVKP